MVLSEAGAGGLDSCPAFYKAGDYTDLAWMAGALVHGHAMDWAQPTAPRRRPRTQGEGAGSSLQLELMGDGPLPPAFASHLRRG